MDLHLHFDKPKVGTWDDDEKEEDREDTDDSDDDNDTIDNIICPSCGEDLNIVDEEELFEGAELQCDACGVLMEVTGFDKNTPILRQIEEQK